ncbi:MAG: hypothetical protein ABI873_02795, partial [Marmoricola sp.]
MKLRIRQGKRRPVTLVTVAALLALTGIGAASAQGGTAKPPPGAVSPWVVPTLPDPVFSVAVATLHGFDDTGIVQ